MVMKEVLILVRNRRRRWIAVAWALTKPIQSQLYGMKAADPLTMVLAVFGIAAVGLLSGYVPARRATLVDPIRALRWE